MIDTAASVARRHAIPARRLALMAIVLVVFVALYRFNTLGGALGGFDDDHFVPFAYALQVEAGEQPLRDFTGLGLQGAWPSLTYEVSAAGQRAFGRNLRSEAIVSIAGLAAGTVLTLVAAAFVAPAWTAFAFTLLSVFTAPKLYNYPKVLLLAAAAAAIGWYARNPSLKVAALLGAVTAIAFLFRHDFAVYVAVGAVVAVAAAGRPGRAAAHLAACALVACVLLLPSLVFVQRQVGIATYLRDSVTASRQESGRTQLRWPAFASRSGDATPAPAAFFTIEQNAVAWLYYLHFAVPLLVLLALRRTRLVPWPEARPALAAVAITSLVVAPLFLRGNTAARFGDMAPLAAVLGAGVWTLAWRRYDGSAVWARPARIVLATLAVAASVQSLWVLGSVRSELDASGWSDSLGKIDSQARRRWTDLAALPAAYWTGAPESASIHAIQYVHRCTRESDRVLMMSYQPEILPLADRRFAGGRAGIVPGFLADDRHQREIVARWAAEPVPLALVEEDPEYAREIPIVYEHLVTRYRRAGALTVDGGVELAVFVERARTPAGSFPGTSLPCFQ